MVFAQRRETRRQFCIRDDQSEQCVPSYTRAARDSAADKLAAAQYRLSCRRFSNLAPFSLREIALGCGD
jgi:hypothetical protein